MKKLKRVRKEKNREHERRFYWILKQKNFWVEKTIIFQTKKDLRRKMSPPFPLLVWIHTHPLSRAHFSLKINVHVQTLLQFISAFEMKYHSYFTLRSLGWRYFHVEFISGFSSILGNPCCSQSFYHCARNSLKPGPKNFFDSMLL